MDRPHIAALDLIAIDARGTRSPLALRIGAPERISTGEWQCAVRLDGLYDGLLPMHGEDSVQALCLALGLAGTLLRGFVADGGRLIEVAEDGGANDVEDWPLEAYFGWLGTHRAPAT